MHLDTPVSEILKVGKTTALKLHRLGVFKARDLLHFFPFRYEDYSHIKNVGDLVEGEVVTIKVKIELIANRRTPRQRKNITEALVSDATGSIRAVWFNQPFLIKNLAGGDEVYLSGTVKTDILGPQLVSPAYEKVRGGTLHTARLVPIYPLTAGLSEKQVRLLVKQVVPLAGQVGDWLPEEIKKSQNVVGLGAALAQIHFPESNQKLHEATERLKFDELFLLQLQAELSRREQQQSSAPVLPFHESEIKEFVNALPFTLTKTQKISAWEILQNIGAKTPMNRLLSGDVGSGKTVVAALVLYNTVLSGYQGVLMAPTEILAQQHFESLRNLLPRQRVALFSRSAHTQAENGMVADVSKAELIEGIKNGMYQIIIGTHALLSEGVAFNKVGLVIVDEQHRFGVAQRKIIKEKGRGVHFLSMTATPIPRSLALMLYGDLDVSIISELPVGRKQIITKLVEPSQREKAYGFIRDQVKLGRQVFVICPLIESAENETADKKSVLAEYKKLSTLTFPDLKVGYLHGKMKGEEKEKIMDNFKNKKTDILVSTSVIEVGVNIPNASVMMIEGADKFGLAQLHQFRGRVGRAEHQSYCLLFTESDQKKSNERLTYFAAHHNGFALAEKDLELRGPGEVYGTAQSGMMQLRLAKLTDVEIIKKARAAAQMAAPRLQEFPELVRRIREWENSVHLE